MSFMYVCDYKARIYIEKGKLVVESKNNLKRMLPLEQLEGLVIFGNASVSTGCFSQLLRMGIPVTFLSHTGMFFGRLESTKHINIERQRKQFKLEEYFIPKPILDIKMKDITKRHDSQNQQKKNKSFKKLEYISVSDLNNYLLAAKGEGDFNPDEAIEKSVFGISQIKVSTSVKGLKESLPYYIGTFVFNNDCGLYVIVAYESETERKLFERLLHLLSYSGIGGKRTSGLGKFEIDDCIYLDAPYTKSLEILSRMLKDKDSKIKITLSVSLPADNELDEVIPGGSFMLIRRGGFVQSQTYSDTPLKKKDIYAFSAGSCFKKSFNGDIYDVSLEGAHPVSRYLKPLFLGVNM
jgi:CRISPR-associated protein Csm4